MNHKKKLGMGIVFGALGSVMFLGIMFVVFIIHIFIGNKTITTDITKYEETMNRFSDDIEYHTGLIIFPEQIQDNATPIDFYCLEHTFLFGSVGEFFLQCTYDEAGYQAEIERLENIYKRYGSVVNKLIYDEENFAYPAYIAIEGNGENYEYALLNGEGKITYIYTSYFNQESEKIKKEYMPFELKNSSNQTQEELSENYSIYLVRRKIMADGLEAWEYDYTRDATVKVLNHHFEEIDYNVFYVNTYLNETDTEIIQDCSFMYYESKYDSIYGLADEIVYEELQGYRFKSLEINEEKTIATVTYYDGGEEKTKEYEIPKV